MNYVQLFANGGKTSDRDLIKGIQQILGVDDTQMEQLLQIGINKYGSLEGIGQALNEATQGLTPNSSPEEVQAAVASVFSTNEPSQMFKCGGKLQQLAAKFEKGGNVGCGCGGIKLNQRGGVTDGKPFQQLPSAIYNENGILLGYDNEPQTWDYINSRQNPRTWTITHPSLQARLNNTVNQSKMLWNPESLQERPYNVSTFTRLPGGSVSTLRQRPSINRSNYVEIEQDGGAVLNRKRAKELAKSNKGLNNEQFNLAFQNAKNALRSSGLTGKDLRTKALAMVSGYSDELPAVESTFNSNIDFVPVDGLVGTRPTREQLVNPIITIEDVEEPKGFVRDGSTPNRSASSSRTYRPNPNIRATGVNPLDAMLDEANRNYEARKKAWEAEQAAIAEQRSRAPYVTLPDTSVAPSTPVNNDYSVGIWTPPVVQNPAPARPAHRVIDLLRAQRQAQQPPVSNEQEVVVEQNRRPSTIELIRMQNAQRPAETRVVPIHTQSPVPIRRQGGQIEKGQFGMSIIHPVIVTNAAEKNK